eukprot:350944-Pleurochrysis_carterae.AAC.1
MITSAQHWSTAGLEVLLGCCLKGCARALQALLERQGHLYAKSELGPWVDEVIRSPPDEQGRVKNEVVRARC